MQCHTDHSTHTTIDMELGGIVDVINNSETLLCYWAMWESARYCMLSRLRTPFGGPQQVRIIKMLTMVMS